jgi:hypothetical protein
MYNLVLYGIDPIGIVDAQPDINVQMDAIAFTQPLFAVVKTTAAINKQLFLTGQHKDFAYSA